MIHLQLSSFNQGNVVNINQVFHLENLERIQMIVLIIHMTAPDLPQVLVMILRKDLGEMLHTGHFQKM